MTNTSVTLTSLDFDTLKQNFQSYLTNQTAFKDYNFTGSNMNVLLDVMSYNSYLNSFYLNMVASEMFLDSAQKFDSIVSHAKELNYVPRSNQSAAANISFTFTSLAGPPTFTIPKGTQFSGQNSNGSFIFTTSVVQNFNSVTSSFTVDNLRLYEGFYIQDAFVMDYTIESQKFILSNPKIDTDSLTVTVIESGANTVFTRVDTLYGLSNTSNVYFLQGSQNNQYEIVFGDGLLGRVPNNLATIVADYRITNGSDAQGVSSFLLVDNLNGTPSTITTLSSSTGGANAELIESVRKSAPRYFATQQRAVASDDYSSLVLAKFGGQISDVSVYGGETVEPKQYGRVIVTLKPAGGTIAADYLKNQVTNYLANYISLPTRVIIADPEYIYVGVNTTVQYNVTGTINTSAVIVNEIRSSISAFSTSTLEKFNSDFRYSKFAAAIDASDLSITSNDTEVLIIKRISPLLNYATSYTLEFNNTAYKEDYHSYSYTPTTPFYDEPTLTSSAFTYVDSNDVSWPLSYIRDDNFGNLVIYTIINGVFTVLNNAVGTIDYTTGYVTIKNLKVSAYNNYISLYMYPKNKDILANKNKIVLIDLNDVNISLIATQK
jgi:hypothetical protein